MLKYAVASVVLILGFAAVPASAEPRGDDSVSNQLAKPYDSEDPARIRQESAPAFPIRQRQVQKCDIAMAVSTLSTNVPAYTTRWITVLWRKSPPTDMSTSRAGRRSRIL